MIRSKSDVCSSPASGEAAPAFFWILLCFIGTFPWLLIDLPSEISRPGFSGRDFDCLWVAGRMVWSGQIGDIYPIDAFRSAFKAVLQVNATNQIYSYPPYALFIAAPFALLPYPAALVLWNLGTLLCFIWATRPYLSKRLPWWVLAISPSTLICFGFGHYGLLVSALFVLSFRGSGLSAAVMTFKPHIGILVAVQMLRDRQALPYAVLGTLVLIAASVVVFGWHSWLSFFTISIPFQFNRVHGTVSPLFQHTQVSPLAGYGLPGLVLCGTTAIYLLTRCFNVFTAATATFLIAPYGFHYDMPAASLGFAYLIAYRFDQMVLWQKIVAVLGFCTPGLAAIGTWFAPPALLLGLYLQTELFGRQPVDAAAERRTSQA